MIHVRQARSVAQDLLAAETGEGKPIERAVIIDDLFGKIRALVWLTVSAPTDFANRFKVSMNESLGSYWSGLWVANGAAQADAKLYNELWSASNELGPSLRLSDRVRSRGFWMNPPSDPAWPAENDNPPVVAFYSFKGGVGRTTALASFAIQRARIGETVVVIDLDLDAPGVGKLLDSGRSVSDEQFGVVDYLMELPVRTEIDLRDYYYLSPSISDRGRVLVFPAGRIDPDYLEMLARLDLEPTSESALHPLLRLLDHIRKELAPDWLLLDCRAGLSEASGFALSGLANLTVLFGTTSPQSWEGLRVVIERLGAQRVRSGMPQAECLVVQAMTPEQPQTAELAKSAFLAESENVFKESYYAEDPSNEEDDKFWYVRDMESEDAPHQPSILSYSQKLAFISWIGEVAEALAEDPEYTRLARRIASRFGREPE
jgi:MinD-like ATPase involved in chromosome partitioning or flagellar assembly